MNPQPIRIQEILVNEKKILVVLFNDGRRLSFDKDIAVDMANKILEKAVSDGK